VATGMYRVSGVVFAGTLGSHKFLRRCGSGCSLFEVLRLFLTLLCKCVQAKAAESRSFSVETLDSESFQSESGIEYNQKLYRFIQLRMQVCREMNIPGRDESDIATELSSNHLMCSGMGICGPFYIL